MDRATSRINAIEKANSSINIVQNESPSKVVGPKSPIKLNPLKFHPDFESSVNHQFKINPNSSIKFKSEEKSKIRIKQSESGQNSINFSLRNPNFLSHRKDIFDEKKLWNGIKVSKGFHFSIL